MHDLAWRRDGNLPSHESFLPLSRRGAASEVLLVVEQRLVCWVRSWEGWIWNLLSYEAHWAALGGSRCFAGSLALSKGWCGKILEGPLACHWDARGRGPSFATGLASVDWTTLQMPPWASGPLQGQPICRKLHWEVFWATGEAPWPLCALECPLKPTRSCRHKLGQFVSRQFLGIPRHRMPAEWAEGLAGRLHDLKGRNAPVCHAAPHGGPRPCLADMLPVLQLCPLPRGSLWCQPGPWWMQR